MTQETSDPAAPDPAESPTADSRSRENQCPECDGITIPGSDKCQHCGAPLESGTGISLEMWEWGGALAAGFGFFLTPVLPGPIALYCAYRVYEFKPKASYGILIAFLFSVIFWILVPLFILPS